MDRKFVLQKMRCARFTVFPSTLAICFSACAPDPSAIEQRRSEQHSKVFSAEDRRIAGALSLGGGAEGGAQNPADEAATCVIALNFIRARFVRSVGLNSEQAKALDNVIAQYRTRAGAKTMSATRFAQKLEAAETAMPEEADQARASLRCLQAFK